MVSTATELSAWANTREARGLLPITLRRLFHGSIANVRSVSFPGGDSIQLSGFDGDLDVERGNAWVPDETSVWEFGCNKKVKGKADGDYETRTNNMTAKVRQKRTFVFVRKRPFPFRSDDCLSIS